MRAALSEFWRDAPTLIRSWVVVSPLMILVGVVLYGMSVPDALTITGIVIGAGIPSLGFLWLRLYAERQTLAAFGVAVAWAILTAIPGIAIGTILGLLVQAALSR